MNTNKKTATTFKDVKLDVKIKLSALWVALMLCYIYGDILSFYKPGNISEIIAGLMGPFLVTQIALLISAILMVIPAVMVFLSLTLKPKANRLTNIILGVLFIVVSLSNLIGETWAYYIFFGIAEIAFTSLIVWYSWKWPKLKDSANNK